MNNYLIVANDKVEIDLIINKIIKENPNSSVTYYDLDNTYITNAIEELDTYNLLANKKIVICKNFKSISTIKEEQEQNLDILVKYLKNPNIDNTLILITPNLDKRKKAVNDILKLTKVIEPDTNIYSLINSYIKDYKIDDKAKQLLIEYTGNNKERILNELDKLMNYKNNDKLITCNDIELIVTKTLDDNIFHFIDSILDKDKNYAFTLYNNFILYGYQLTNIISLLANKIRLIYNVKVLINKGYNEKEIAETLKQHPYTIKLAHEKINKYSDEFLLKYLKILANIDLNIKSGKSDGTLEFNRVLAEI